MTKKTHANDSQTPSNPLTDGRFKSFYSWYLVAILFVAYTISYVDRQILSLLVEPMKRDLDISDTQMSLLQGMSFALFYTVMGLPLGRLADSTSRRGVIAAGMAIWSAMTMLCGMVNNFILLFLARMGVGFGEAALSPAAYSLITDSVDKKKLGTAIGTYSMAIYFGAGLALIVGGTVVQWAEGLESIVVPLLGQIHSWQLVFLIVGVPGFLLVPVMFTIREPKRKFSGPNNKAASIKHVLSYFKTNKRAVLLHSLAASFNSFGAYAALAWVPTFLIRNEGFTSAQSGLFYGIIVLFFGAAGVVTSGKVSDMRQKRGVTDAKLSTPMIGLLIGIVPTMLFPFMPNLALLFVVLGISTFFTNFSQGVGPAAVQEMVPADMRGQFSAFYLFVVNLVGLGLGPTAVALLTDYVFQDPLAVKYSIAIVVSSGLLISSILFKLASKPYLNTVNNLEAQQA